jgi:hypothetical protein
VTTDRGDQGLSGGDLLQEGERLLVAAFERARASGHPDWQRMRTAVLKNRLLEATDRQFSERDWGVETFSEFLGLFPNVVAVDKSEHPPIAELLPQPGAEATGVSASRSIGPTSRRQRIRSDLWNSVLDFSSGNRYVWDTDEARAIAVADGADDPRPQLPTLDREAFARWREEFAQDQLEGAPPHQASAIERWRDAGLGPARLPSPLRGLWNAELKRRVAERLREWFAQQGIPTPADLITTTGAGTRGAAPDAERLRNFVQRTIAVMTRSELEAIQLPAAAVLRSRGNRAPSD